MEQNEKIFRDAVALLNRGQFTAAEQHFKEILNSEPMHIGALNLITIALMSMRRNEEAEHFAKAAIKADQSSDVTFYNYGLILKSLHRPREALVQFNKALALNAVVAETWEQSWNDFQ